MFELLTATARHAMFIARDNAFKDGADFIEGHHLLSAVLAERDASALRMLSRLGIGLDALQSSLPGISGRPTGPRTREIPFTPTLKEALNVAGAEAERSPGKQMGSRELLIGLFSVDNSLPSGVLRPHERTLPRLRAAAADLES